MSYTSSVRDELARVFDHNVPAMKAELVALVRIMGTIGGTGTMRRIELATENAPVARKIINLARLAFGLKTELTGRKSVLHNTNNYLITIPAQGELKRLLDEGGLMGGDNHTWGIPSKLVSSNRAAVAYLRGAFLSTGFIADPKGDYHFEFALHNETLALEIQALMERFNIESKVAPRRGSWTVYIKSSDQIMDFLALVGAHKSLLDAEDMRVLKSVRNDVVRKVNAEVANQKKASNSAAEQAEALRIIDQEGSGLASLPDALYEFAQLRLNNPELSLRDLGEQASPPLSKSAVNHRVRRIMAIADEIRRKKKL